MGCCSSKKKSRAVPELDPSEVDQIWHKSMEEAYKHIKMHNDHLRKAEICRDREDHARCRMYQELAQVEWKASREARIEGEKEFFKEMNHSAYGPHDYNPATSRSEILSQMYLTFNVSLHSLPSS